MGGFTFSGGQYLIELSVALARLKFDIKERRKLEHPTRVDSNTPSFYVQ